MEHVLQTNIKLIYATNLMSNCNIDVIYVTINTT